MSSRRPRPRSSRSIALLPTMAQRRRMPASAYASTVDHFFSDGRAGMATAGVPERLARFEQVQQNLRALTPRNDNQRLIQSEALALSHGLAQTRWMLIQ